MTNMWIICKEVLKRKGREEDSFIHLEFILQICKAMTYDFQGQKWIVFLLMDDVACIHCLTKSHQCSLLQKDKQPLCNVWTSMVMLHLRLLLSKCHLVEVNNSSYICIYCKCYVLQLLISNKFAFFSHSYTIC